MRFLSEDSSGSDTNDLHPGRSISSEVSPSSDGSEVNDEHPNRLIKFVDGGSTHDCTAAEPAASKLMLSSFSLSSAVQ